MKYIVVLGDGMADEPIASLGGLTPLQYADTPAMDKLATVGCSGMLKTVPEGFAPGSEIANLAVLGYHLPTVFEGRGSLEAASMSIDIDPNEMAMRCNLITIENDKIKNHSAGHITTHEAHELMSFLQHELGNELISFWGGVSYRNLLKIKGGDKRLSCTPPHDVPGADYKSVMVMPTHDDAIETANLLNELILKSQMLLESHPINVRRKSEGKEPANSIWMWSPGYKPKMETLSEKYGINSGSVISAVDLIRGIGVYAGLDVIDVEGATGLYDTNYEGKVAAALKALETQDFVFLHIEASDEAGHEGDVELKRKTVTDLDHRVLAPIMKSLALRDEKVVIALLPDHPTPCAIRTHTANPVPFTIYNPELQPDDVMKFDEFSAQKGGYGLLDGDQFMEKLINYKR